MLASDEKHENMVKIKTEVLDSCRGKPVTSVFNWCHIYCLFAEANVE